MKQTYYEIITREEVINCLNENGYSWLDINEALAKILRTTPDNIAYFNELKTTYHVYLLSEIDYYLTYINKGLFKDFQ